MNEAKLGNPDISSIISDIAGTGSDLTKIYKDLVAAGLITPANGTTPVTVPPITILAPAKKIWEETWFLPAIIGAGLAGVGIFIFAKKRG